MTERARHRLRRIGMRHLIIPALAVALLTLGGCGDDGAAEDTGQDAVASTPTNSVEQCAGSATASVEGDFDGDGEDDRLEFSPRSVDCPAQLRFGGEVTDLDVDRPVAGSDLSTVRVSGVAGDLALYRYQHPRGGFEVRLFAVEDGAPVEISRDGGPLVPFVATDAPTQHVTVRCVPTGFEILEALAHQPVGVAAAWDVRRTAFTAEEGSLRAGAAAEVADNVLDQDLAARFPAVTGNKVFANCAS